MSALDLEDDILSEHMWLSEMILSSVNYMERLVSVKTDVTMGKKNNYPTFEAILVSFSQYGKMFVKVRGSQPARTRYASGGRRGFFSVNHTTGRR